MKLSNENTGISSLAKILRCIFIVIIAIESIAIILLYLKNPLSDFEKQYIGLFLKCILTILFLLGIAIFCYIFEHKKYNKNESILDEYKIKSEFDIDDLNKKDILYLSTILNQKYPRKKAIILLIMQLINKHLIELSMYFDGNNHQYIIEKRNNISYSINTIEKELMEYLFKDSNRVDLISIVKKIYHSHDLDHIVKSCNKYVEEIIDIQESPLKKIYKSITAIIAVILLYLLLCLSPSILVSNTITRSSVIISTIIVGLICLTLAFVFIVLLRKINYSYQYNNDSFLWFCKILSLLEFFLIISFFLPQHNLSMFLILGIYVLALLAIMIKYNKHFSLSKEDVAMRDKLISLKNYLQNMDYLTDKDFGNIITYENYIMYGFLFNITLKINKEFDLLQKELLDATKSEGTLYLELLKSNI